MDDFIGTALLGSLVTLLFLIGGLDFEKKSKVMSLICYGVASFIGGATLWALHQIFLRF